jgi:glutamyl-tRNA reductase
VDPAAAKLPGVFLYDLDDLKSVSEANLRERRKEASAAESLVELEVHEFLVWRQSLEVVPLLVELRQRADEIRKAEVEKAKKRLGGTITPEQEQALEAVTTAIVNKLLHPPTVHIKEIASNGRAKEHMALIRKLLGL